MLRSQLGFLRTSSLSPSMDLASGPVEPMSPVGGDRRKSFCGAVHFSSSGRVGISARTWFIEKTVCSADAVDASPLEALVHAAQIPRVAGP